jgi:Glycosyltransferase sugar-binding region containing DXD motif
LEVTDPEEMANTRISQYWDAERVPAYILDLCESFQVHNPSLPHCLFSETDAERFIAKHFGPREVEAFRGCAIPSMQSDYFRYCVVYVLGGVYADVDYRCVAPLSPLIDRITGGELFSSPTVQILRGGREARWIWSGFFAFRKPRHPFLGLALEIATANMEERLAERLWPVGEKVIESIWLTVGPGVPTFMLLLRDSGSFDAFLKTVARQPSEPFAKLNCDVVGDYERIVEAFEGVRISSHDDMLNWVRQPEFQLPYKDTAVHWKNAKTRIFR